MVPRIKRLRQAEWSLDNARKKLAKVLYNPSTTLQSLNHFTIHQPLYNPSTTLQAERECQQRQANLDGVQVA